MNATHKACCVALLLQDQLCPWLDPSTNTIWGGPLCCTTACYTPPAGSKNEKKYCCPKDRYFTIPNAVASKLNPSCCDEGYVFDSQKGCVPEKPPCDASQGLVPCLLANGTVICCKTGTCYGGTVGCCPNAAQGRPWQGVQGCNQRGFAVSIPRGPPNRHSKLVCTCRVQPLR